jgi:hypothetical protein
MVMPVAFTAAGKPPGYAGHTILHVDGGYIQIVASVESRCDHALVPLLVLDELM